MSHDLRRYASQTNIRLLAGFFLLLIVVGDGLIFIIYGVNAALMGLLCTITGIAPLLLIWLVFSALEFIVKHSREQ
jgi:hypothetical protein